MSKPSRPKRSGPSPWYAKGLRFECQRCGDCCRGDPGVVWVTLDEIVEIAEFLGTAPEEFRARHVRRVGARLSLKERPDGDCEMYEDGCKVYSVRPAQCRTFPFWPYNVHSAGAWRHVGRECPGVGEGRTFSLSEIRERLDDPGV